MKNFIDAAIREWIYLKFDDGKRDSETFKYFTKIWAVLPVGQADTSDAFSNVRSKAFKDFNSI